MYKWFLINIHIISASNHQSAINNNHSSCCWHYSHMQVPAYGNLYVDFFLWEMRLVHYNFCLQKWTYSLLFDKQDIPVHALIQEVSYFSCYTSPLISWSQMWQPGGGHFQKTLLCKGTEGCSTSAPSSGEISDSASLASHNRLSALLLESVPSESSSSEITLWCGCRSFRPPRRIVD